MALALYAHPFSSYCQKVLIALYENGTPFEFRQLDPEHPERARELATWWPLQRFPVLVERGRAVMEASIIVEYLDLHHRGAVRLLPDDHAAALEVRLMDRCFDNYVMTPMQQIVGDRLRAESQRDPHGVAQAHSLLETAYRWLDGAMAARTWAAGESFSLADCAAAPALFYADWTHGIDAEFRHLLRYRARLLARPSMARAVEEARPYRAFFPLGAPDRD